ncbi:hypothetical protein AAVH_23018 [Aphelenchoides avenae]|nr:hypothetical protein AAVH_23018 [Aphelenchus avenae]
MLNYGILQEPYYMEGLVLSRCFFFSAGFCCFFQCFSHCIIAANRYTVFMHPTKHESIWRGTSFRIILSTMFLIPALAAGVRLAMVVKVVPAGEGHGFINVNHWVNIANAIIAVTVSVSTCLISFALEVRTLQAFRRLNQKNKREYREDFRLLIAQLMLAIYFGTFYTANAAYPPLAVSLQRFFPYVIDTLSFGGSICLLLTR